MILETIKSKRSSLDFRDFLFLLSACGIVAGCYLLANFLSGSRICASAVALLVGGAIGMYLTYASAPAPVEEAPEEFVVDPQKGVIRKAS